MRTSGGGTARGDEAVWRVMLAALGASVGVTVMVVVFFVPSFMTNDDPVLSLIAAGRLLASAPDEHLLYSNVLVGLCLQWLYRHVPDWPWYSAHLSLALCVASTLTMAACLQWTPQVTVRWLVWLLGLGILGAFVLELQFTVAAIWLAWASAIWCVSTYARRAPRSWGPAIVGVLGVTWAGLIRAEGATLGVLMALPMIPWGWRSMDRVTRRLAAGVFLVGLAAVWGADGANRAYYRSADGWEDFYPLNTAKTYATDNDLVREGPETDRALADVGWHANDLEMMRRWFFLHDEVFSLRNIKRVAMTSTRRSLGEAVGRAVDRLGAVRREPMAEIGFALMVFLVLVAESRIAAWALAVGAWWVCIALALAAVARPMPPRVYLPCLVAVIGTALLLASSSRIRPSRRAVIVAGALLVFPSLGAARSLMSTSESHRARVEQFTEDWRLLREQEPRLVVAWGDALPFELVVSPFRERLVDVGEVGVASIGFLARTPLTRATLRGAGIDDLHTAMIDDPKVLLVAREPDLAVLATFIARRYGSTVRGRPVLVGETFTAWRLVRGPGRVTP